MLVHTEASESSDRAGQHGSPNVLTTPASVAARSLASFQSQQAASGPQHLGVGVGAGRGRWTQLGRVGMQALGHWHQVCCADALCILLELPAR